LVKPGICGGLSTYTRLGRTAKILTEYGHDIARELFTIHRDDVTGRIKVHKHSIIFSDFFFAALDGVLLLGKHLNSPPSLATHLTGGARSIDKAVGQILEHRVDKFVTVY